MIITLSYYLCGVVLLLTGILLFLIYKIWVTEVIRKSNGARFVVIVVKTQTTNDGNDVQTILYYTIRFVSVSVPRHVQ